MFCIFQDLWLKLKSNDLIFNCLSFTSDRDILNNVFIRPSVMLLESVPQPLNSSEIGCCVDNCLYSLENG